MRSQELQHCGRGRPRPKRVHCGGNAVITAAGIVLRGGPREWSRLFTLTGTVEADRAGDSQFQPTQKQAVVGHWMTVTEWQKNVLFINVNNSCGSTCGCVWALLSLSRSI